VISPVQEPESV